MSQQEQKLRRVEQEAMQRQQEQLRLARELAEKEEANLQVGYDAYIYIYVIPYIYFS